VKARLSLDGQARLKREEGLRLDAYDDRVGIRTIGYGHRITDEDIASSRFANGLTLAEAELLFEQDVQHAERLINAWIKVPLNVHQWDALVSLIFNEGLNPIWTSNPSEGTLGRKLNAGDYAGAGEQFKVWNKAYDKKQKKLVVLDVLVNRRARELALWNTPDDGTAQ